MPIDIERLLRDDPFPIDAESVEDVHRLVFGGTAKRMAPAHYDLHEELGRGRYGRVHRATDTSFPREVALKLIAFDDSHQLARLEREARALARLSHPNVVTVFEKGIADVGRYFLATELVHGTRLDVWMAAPGRSLVELLEIFAQAAEGLEHAHQRGLVHRDFKPNNAIVDQQGRLRILDFGLAKVLQGSDSGPSPEQRHRPSVDAYPVGPDVTVSEHGPAPTGALHDDVALSLDPVVGTPGYAAPEQLEGKPVDPRSDQFSLCVALFEACYGFRPFSGRTIIELSEQIHGQRFVPGHPRHRVPRWLARLLRRGLSPNPGERFESVGRIATILRGHIDRRVPTWAALVAGVTFALGAVAVVNAWTTPKPPAIDVAWDPWAREDAEHLAAGFGPGLVERLEAYEQRWLDAKGRFPGIPGAQEAELDANECFAAGERAFAALVHGLVGPDPAQAPSISAPTDGSLEALWLERLFDPEGCLEATPRWEHDEGLVDGLRTAQAARLGGRHDDAIAALVPLLDRTATSGAAEGFVHYELGIARSHVRDPHALHDLRDAIRHHGHDPRFYTAALVRLVEARVVLGPDAAQGLSEALDDLQHLETDDPLVERARGHAWLRLGRYEAAGAAFGEARAGFAALPKTRHHALMAAICQLDRAYAESNLPGPRIALDALPSALEAIGTTLGTAHPLYLQHATQVARLMGDDESAEDAYWADRGHTLLAPAVAAVDASQGPLRLVIPARAELLRLAMESRSTVTRPWDEWLAEADAIEALLVGRQEIPDFWHERDIFHVQEILFSVSATHVEEQPASAKTMQSARTAIRRIDRLFSEARPMGRVEDVCGYLRLLDDTTGEGSPLLTPEIKGALPSRSLEILAQSWTLCR